MGTGLHHSGHQEYLVVRRQAVDDRHDQHQHRAHQRAGGEVEQVGTHAVDEQQGQDAQGSAGAQQVHDHRLRRQDDRAEDQRQQDERHRDDVEQHPGQLVEQCLDRLDLHRRGAGDQHLGIGGDVVADVAQFVDDALIVVTVGDAGRQHGHAVLRGLGDLEVRGQALDGIGLLIHPADGGGVSVDDDLHRIGAEGGEGFVEVGLGDAGVVVRRQVGLVDATELHPGHRDGQQDQDADDADGHKLGVLHREGGDLAPPGVHGGIAGTATPEDGELVDVGPQHREDARQHRHTDQGGQADRGDRAVGHGLQEGLREHHQAGQGNRHHQGGEDHSLARGGGGVAHRCPGVGPLGEFLAEAGDHEQAVVDGQAQTQQCHHGLGESVDLHDPGEERQDAHGAEDGEHTDDQRHAGGDHAAEDHQQQQGDDRQADQFGAGDVVGHAGVQGAGHGGGAADLHGRPVGGDLVQVVLDDPEVLQHLVLGALETDRGEGGLGAGLGVLAEHLLLVGVEEAGHPCDFVGVGHRDGVDLAGDALLQRRVTQVSAISALTGALAGDQHDDVAAVVTSERLLLDLRGAGRVTVRVVPALLAHPVAQLGAQPQVEHRDEQDDHRRNDPTESEGDIAPLREHVSSLLICVVCRISSGRGRRVDGTAAATHLRPAGSPGSRAAAASGRHRRCPPGRRTPAGHCPPPSGHAPGSPGR